MVTTQLKSVRTTSWRVGVIFTIIILPATLIFVFWFFGDATSDGEVKIPTPPTIRYCAYVIKEPAAVYPAPDTNTKPIKFKARDDRIETLDHPHPPGWIVVRTPRDSPGFNWMQTAILTTAAPCSPS
jgi:hypothetical protein